MLANLQVWLHKLPELFPSVIDESQITELMLTVKRRVVGLGEQILTSSLTSLVNVMAMLVVIVVPLLVFFMLKDRNTLLAHFSRILPLTVV